MSGRLAVHSRAALPLLLAALAMVGCGRPEPGQQPEAPLHVERQDSVSVQLYFPGEDGRLYAERREIPAMEDPEAQAEVLLRALLSGPESELLQEIFPAEVRLETVLLRGDGIAYVDFQSSDALPPGVGSTAEMQRLMSIVDSLSLNLSEVRRVVLLWNGAQLESFGGHLDTSRPVAPDTSLIAQ